MSRYSHGLSRRQSIYGTEDRIVLDIGSLYIKCGLSGEPRPRHIIPVYAQTGFSKEKHGAMHSVEGQCKELYTTSLFLPDPWEDDDFSGIHETTYTTDTVTAMSAMESVESPTASHADIQFSRIETQLSQLLRSIYFDYLLTDPKSRKVTICESPLLPVQLKQLIAKILFQHFHAPSISFAPIHFLAILSTGRTTGLVVDVGNLETIVLPVYLSRPLFPYIKTSLLAGKAFTLSLRRLLLSFGRIIPDSSLHSELATQYPLTPSILTRNLLEDIKVRLCIVSPLMAADKSIMRDLNEVQIHQTYADLSTATNIRLQITVKEDVLYDDQKILSIGDRATLLIPGWVRERAAEVLFQGDEDDASVTSCILDVLLKVPSDLRRPLASSLLLIGGTTQTPGFQYRVQSELMRALSQTGPGSSYARLSGTAKYLAFADDPTQGGQGRVFMPNVRGWVGGSLMGSLKATALDIARDKYDGTLPDWSFGHLGDGDVIR